MFFNQPKITKICSLVSLVLGGIVLIGWYAQIPFLIQVHPSFVPMQFNTALGFFMAGLGLFIVNGNRLKFGWVFGVLVQFIGLLTLIEYIFQTNLGIDELLMDHYITQKTSHPGRMAPNTALCFFLTGSCIVIGQSFRKSQKVFEILGVIGGCVFALGTVAGSGYILDLEATYGWGKLTRMALHTSIGFIFLGFGVISLAWINSCQKHSKIPEWGSILFGLGSLIATIAIFQAVSANEKILIRDKVRVHANLVEVKIIEKLKFQTLELIRMGSRVERGKKLSQMEWEADARNYLKDNSNYIFIKLMDSSLNTLWGVSKKEIGLNNLLDQNFDNGVQKTIEKFNQNEKVKLSEIITFKGEKLFFEIIPLFRNENIDGWILAGISLESFMKNILSHSLLNKFFVKLYQNEKLEFSNKQQKPEGYSDFEFPIFIDAYGISWKITILPDRKFYEESRSSTDIIILTVGLLVTFLIILITHLLQKEGIRRGVVEETHEALRKVTHQNEMILASAGEGIYGVDLDGNTTFVNPSGADLLGFRQQDLLGKNFHLLSHHTKPNGSPYPVEECNIYAAIKEGKVTQESNEIFWKKDGTSFPVEYLSTPIIEQGEITGAVVTFRDITARIEAEEQINAARDFQDLVMRTIPDLIFVKDEQLRIVQANESFMQLYPKDKRDKIIGYTTLEEYDPEQVKKFTENDREAFMTGYNEADETILFPTGKYRALFTKKVRFYNDGKPYLLGISRDISQIKATENELKQANKELEHFAYIASHDLKAPMRGIDNLAKWIAEDLKDIMDEDVKEKIELMRQRISRLEMLLEDILSYSSAGRIVDEPKDIDTKELIEDVIESLNKREDLKVIIPESLPVINSTYASLHRIFFNLINNSYKHHDKEEVHIEILYEDRGLYGEYAVKDDGPGIAPEFHERVFKMFQTLKSRDEIESSGLGLAIIKKLVEWQGGKVWIDSVEGERGTTVRFLWPKTYRKASINYDRKAS